MFIGEPDGPLCERGKWWREQALKLRRELELSTENIVAFDADRFLAGQTDESTSQDDGTTTP